VGLPHTALRRLQHVDCERAGFAQPLHSATYGTNRPAGSAIGKAFATGGTRAAVRRSQSKASEQLFRVSSLPLDSLVSPPNVAPMWPPFCPFLAALHPAVRREDVRDVDTSAREPVNEATAGEPNPGLDPGRQGCEFSRPSSKVMVPDAKRKETTVGIEHLPGSAIPSDRRHRTGGVHRRRPPGRATGRLGPMAHHGDHHVVAYVLGGTIHVDPGPTGNGVIQASAGDLLYIEPGTVHRERYSQGELATVGFYLGSGPGRVDVDGHEGTDP
jgi:mannose-6-phosphate isomerase-like protein (cupin superfamily)